ncbi:NlpC/P60 family protein [Deinococcus altitudinis]|uniref:C40 family peptidase n=1 Tax=Deinococcus altitudinis TaxID=468914 RepID=UPI0038927DB7
MSELDLRVRAVNTERGVVEPALEGQFPALRVLAPRTVYAAGQLALHARPDGASPQVTEALHGEALEVLEELPGEHPPGGWAWVRTLHDGYLGYARLDGLSGPAPVRPVTVQVPRSHLFAAPSIKARVLTRLGRGAALSTLDSHPARHGEYLWWRVAFGEGEAYLHDAAVQPPSGDLPTFAENYLHTPYLWGGRTAWGLDCSGLSQLWAGRDAHSRSRLPRDADQQHAATTPVEKPEAGDLAFFPGHVGIMLGERRMLHANATHLRVTVETLGEGEYGRRLQAGLLGFGRVGAGP